MDSWHQKNEFHALHKMKNSCQKRGQLQGKLTTTDSFVLSYLTVVIIILGVFVYLTSNEELKTKEAQNTWQNIKLAFNAKIKAPNQSPLTITIDPALKKLLTKEAKDKIQFSLNLEEVFEPDNDQIKPAAISILSQIVKIALQHQTKISSNIAFFLQSELSPLHFKEAQLTLNRSHSLQRFFNEELQASQLINSYIVPMSKTENQDHPVLEVTLEI